MTRRFLFSVCVALMSMCAISFSSCSSDDDDDTKDDTKDVYKKPSLSFSINKTNYKNGDVVMALDKASISDANKSSDSVSLSYTITKGTSDIKTIDIKYSNDYVSNLYVTDKKGNIWNGKDKGGNSMNGELSFIGVYAKYTITITDVKDSITNISFVLSGNDLEYSSVARSLSNKQTIKISYDGKKYEKSQLGISYSPETIEKKGKFVTNGEMLKITESQYLEYQKVNAQSFTRNAETNGYQKTDKTINDTAPIFYLYKNSIGNYTYYYLLKVISLDDNTATIEVQY